MEAQQVILASDKEGAEIFYEDEICRQKVIELFVNNRIPNGLWPLKDVIEFGYNKETGFFWVKQQNKIDHRFTAIRRNATFDQELSGFIEDRKMTKITGVNAKELFIWVSIVGFSIGENNPEKLDFITPTGFKKTFPVSAFELPKQESSGTAKD